jgi:hypothetical protein
MKERNQYPNERIIAHDAVFYLSAHDDNQSGYMFDREVIVTLYIPNSTNSMKAIKVEGVVTARNIASGEQVEIYPNQIMYTHARNLRRG